MRKTILLTFPLLLSFPLLFLFHLMPAQAQPPAPARAQEAQATKGRWALVWRTEGAVYDFLGVDGNTLLGVGTDGMILKSTNGGGAWHYQSLAATQDLHALDGTLNNLWAVGESGLVLRSLDGGETWETLDPGVAITLTDVAVMGTHAWIVGQEGTIRHTADRGQTWQAQTSGVDVSLQTVAFFSDARHGLAGGKRGTLLITEDGGQQWQALAGVIPAYATVKDIFLHQEKAWLVTNTGQVYRSQDQGKTWQLLANLGFPITRIRMFPDQPDEGWLVGLDGKMARTTDGGQSWDPNRGDEGYHLYALGIGDDSVWVGGSVVVENMGNWGDTGDRPSWFVWGSQDRGRRWQALVTGLYPRFYNVTAASEQIAYAVGQDLQILKTEDAGYSWQEIHQQIIANPDILPEGADVRGKMLHAISCAPEDPNDCHAAGRTEMLIHTTDGGRTWTREWVPGVGRSLYDVVMTSAQTGIAVSRDYNYFTEDGVTWRGSFDNGEVMTNLDLDMINASQGAVSTKKNYFRYTLDGGRHWSGYFFYGFGSFYNSGADALDYNGDGKLDYVWLTGCTEEHKDGPCIAGAVLFNPDALHDQKGWRALLLDPEVPRLQKIEMVDDQTGWVIGFEGTVLFTEDGGATWQRQPVPTDSDLYGLDVYHRGLVYAVGLRGDILRYSEPDRRLRANPQWENRVDGDLSEWHALNGRHLNSEDMDAIQGETPAAEDLDAWVRVRWDDAGLYLGLDVTDTTLVTTGDLPDQIGVALDGLRDGLRGDDDHVLLFRADGSAQGMPPGGRYAIQSREQGYTVEAFLPQDALGGGFAHLRKIGVNFALYDARPNADSFASQMIWAGTTLGDTPEDFGYITLYQHDRNQPTQQALAQFTTMHLDGDLSDWSDEKTYALTAASADTLQGQDLASEADLAGALRMRWWENALFVGIEVQDDQVTSGDALRFALDVDGDSALSPADRTYRIRADGRVWVNGRPSPTVVAASRRTETGYTLEVAIPAEEIGGPFQAQTPRQRLHFNYALVDDDSGDGRAESILVWQGASVDGVRADDGWLEITPLTVLVKASFDDPRFQDTFINQWAPTTNYDTLDTMRIRTDGIESPLIQVDFSDMLPEHARLTLAYLGLYTVQDRGNAQLTARMYRLLRPWDVTQATWQQAAQGTPWQVPGAKGAEDQAAEPTDRQDLAPMGQDGTCGAGNATWFTITQDVHRYLSGDLANHGWVLRGDAGAQINYVVGSTRHANPDCRPEVYLEYIFPAGQLPTPTLRFYLPLIMP